MRNCSKTKIMYWFFEGAKTLMEFGRRTFLSSILLNKKKGKGVYSSLDRSETNSRSYTKFLDIWLSAKNKKVLISLTTVTVTRFIFFEFPFLVLHPTLPGSRFCRLCLIGWWNLAGWLGKSSSKSAEVKFHLTQLHTAQTLERFNVEWTVI